MSKPSRMGSSFAERQAARRGVVFEAPPRVTPSNSTFAERTGKAVKVEPKQVDDESSAVEDKAVQRSESKRPAHKK